MSLVIKSVNSNQIILEKYKNGSEFAILIVFGFIFTIVGIGMFVFMSWDFPFLVFKLVFPAIGIFVVYAAFAKKGPNNKEIGKMVFDNTLGCLAVETETQDRQTGFIKYDEIASFGMYVERQSSGKGNATYYYHSVLYKKDGGEWFLTKHNDELKTQQDLEALKNNVNLNQSYIGDFKPTISNKLEKTEGLGKTTIQWQNPVKWGVFVFILFFVLVFSAIVYSVFLSNVKSPQFSVFPILVLGFIATVFGFIAFATVKQIIKDAITKYAIVINESKFQFLEISKSSDEIKHSKEIELTNLYCILFSYAPGKSYEQSNKLVLYNKIGFDNLMAFRNDPAKEIQEMVTGLKESLKKGHLNLNLDSKNKIEMYLDMLTPVECLQLETWLQEVIRTKDETSLVI